MSLLTNSDWPVRILLIVLAAAILFMLLAYYGNKGNSTSPTPERFQTHVEYAPVTTETSNISSTYASAQDISALGNVTGQPATASAPTESKPPVVQASEPLSNENYLAVSYDAAKNAGPNNACFPRDTPLTADDLLPKDAACTQWSQANPAGQGSLQDTQLLTAGYHIGVNTVGQSLRNPNLQIRSEPPNPRMNVSPWNQTTIEFDDSRKFFEIGTC